MSKRKRDQISRFRVLETFRKSRILLIFSIIVLIVSLVISIISGIEWILMVVGGSGIYISYRTYVSRDMEIWGRLDRWISNFGRHIGELWRFTYRCGFAASIYWCINEGKYIAIILAGIISIIVWTYNRCRD